MRTPGIILLLLLSACSYRVEKELAPSALSSSSLGFAEVQTSILGPKCARCHGWVASYEGVLANLEEISARVKSADANFSMPPPGASALTPEEKTNLLAWIAKGAPRVGGGEPGETGGEQGPPPAPPIPEPPAPPVPPPGPILNPALSYANVRDSVLIPKCARCHSGMVNSYDAVIENLSEINSRVRSEFDFDMMPPARASQLTSEEKNLLLDWIATGAPKEEAAPTIN